MLHNLKTVLKELMAELSFTGVPFLPQFPDLEIEVCSHCYAGNQYLSQIRIQGFWLQVLHSDHTFLFIAMGKKSAPACHLVKCHIGKAKLSIKELKIFDFKLGDRKS